MAILNLKYKMDKPKLTPWFLLYAGALVTLYWSAGAGGALVFNYRHGIRTNCSHFVDPYGIRFAIASLIVFPISFYSLLPSSEGLSRSQQTWPRARKWPRAHDFAAGAAGRGDLIAL